MKGLILALVASMYTTTATAEPPPPVPDGGLIHSKEYTCPDPETGLQGMCFPSRDMRGNRYIAFFTFGDLCMVIWQVIDGENIEIWRRGADV